jgi:positive regulator of sigma E activity
MKETATVLKVNKSEIILEFHENESCKNCGSMFCKDNDRTYTASNSKGFQLSPGDTVEVYLPPGKTIQASFLVLIAPLILFFLFFILTEKIFGIEREIIKICFGLIGIVIGFFISYLFGKKNKYSNMPLITAKNESAE